MKNQLTTLAAALLISVSGSGLAQDAPTAHKGNKVKATPEQRAAHMTERMTNELGLNDAQKLRVAEINLKHAREMEMVRQQRSDDQRGRMKALRTTHDAAMKEVLTADQYARMQQLCKERAAKHKQKKAQARPERAPAPGTAPTPEGGR